MVKVKVTGAKSASVYPVRLKGNLVIVIVAVVISPVSWSSVHRRIARGMQGMQVHPQGDETICSRHFCWNGAKWG